MVPKAPMVLEEKLDIVASANYNRIKTIGNHNNLRFRETYMKQFIRRITLLLFTCLCVTACGGPSAGNNQTTYTAVSGEAVSENNLTENKQDRNAIPQKTSMKTPYQNCDAAFIIKESSSREYQAEISLQVNTIDIGQQSQVHWELYMEFADEIKEISGASILSHEGTHYIIRGAPPKHSSDDGRNADDLVFKISFGITASFKEQIHEPKFCFFSKKLEPVSPRKYDCQCTFLKKDGDVVTGTICLTNCSSKKITGWELIFNSNFQITSLKNGYAGYGSEHYTYDEKKDLWTLTIYAKGQDMDLAAGETIKISFVGTCPDGQQPKIDNKFYDAFELYQTKDVSDTDTWAVMERQYGADYAKMETYLVADTVWGTNLLFVFDEKTPESYTATAELTNIVPHHSPGSEDEEDLNQSIADWEIYLECEDTIESISGAEIVSHEGNVYCIRTTDPAHWISPYSFTTFQVKVSCPGGIHPLGNTYLKHARIRSGYGSDVTERERTFSFDKDSFQKATGTRWLSYNDLYDPYFETDYFSSDAFNGEWEGFEERQKWGKKMGRMLH